MVSGALAVACEDASCAPVLCPRIATATLCTEPEGSSLLLLGRTNRSSSGSPREVARCSVPTPRKEAAGVSMEDCNAGVTSGARVAESFVCAS